MRRSRRATVRGQVRPWGSATPSTAPPNPLIAASGNPLGALRHLRDRRVVHLHLLGDGAARVAVGQLEVVDDEARRGKLRLEVLALLERRELVGRAVDLDV